MGVGLCSVDLPGEANTDSGNEAVPTVVDTSNCLFFPPVYDER